MSVIESGFSSRQEQSSRNLVLAEIAAVHVVHALWCPHCHTTTVEPVEKVTKELGLSYFSWNIDNPEQEKKADELVRRFGDWSEDYLIPQVFVEMKDGEMHHVLTGYSESIELTKRAVNNLLSSPLFTKVDSHAK
jgi:heterodisulfide reductase subunit B